MNLTLVLFYAINQINKIPGANRVLEKMLSGQAQQELNIIKELFTCQEVNFGSVNPELF